jgi:hypothetical protein
MFIEQAIVARVVNYDYNMFITQATVATAVNYDHKTFIAQTSCRLKNRV